MWDSVPLVCYSWKIFVMDRPTSIDLKTTDFRKDVRLLVIDDSDEHFEQICHITEMYNPEYSVECQRAESCQALLGQEGGSKPTVVLLDIHILSDALAIIQQLSHQGVPVIATSTIRLPQIAETAQQYGAVGYFNKSDNPDDIEALVDFVASVAVAPDSSN